MAQVNLSTRISIETNYKLDRLAGEAGLSKSQVVDQGIQLVYDRIFGNDQEMFKNNRDEKGRFVKS